MKNRTGVATEVLFHAVSHRRSVNSTSKYNRNRTGAISHRCSVNGALMFIAVALNLVGGIESHKSHTCIHSTLRSWKNKKCFFVQIHNMYITIYCIGAHTVQCINSYEWGELNRRTPEALTELLGQGGARGELGGL